LIEKTTVTMPSIFERGNDALNTNRPVGSQVLTVHGSDWLWAVAAVYFLALLIVIATAPLARQGEKIFHYLFIISLFVGSVSYFSLASDLGKTAVAVSNNAGKHPGAREIFFVRYINWFASWPSVFLAVGLVTGVSWTTIVYNIVLGWAYVVTFLVAALTSTKYKWGFFVFGLLAYVLLAHSLLWTPRESTKRLENTRHHYLLSGTITLMLTLYPIALGVSDDGNHLSTTRAFIWIGILDLIFVPFLELGFLVLARNFDYRRLNVYFTQYGRVATEGGERERIEREKQPEATAAV
jgi:bacteriorhodopsin